MFKPFVFIFRKLKDNIIVCAILLALLFVSFQAGIMVGGKSTEEKEEQFKNSEALLKQTSKAETESSLSEINYLKGQLASLRNHNSELEWKLGEAQTKIETFTSQLQDISTKLNDLKKANAIVMLEKSKLEKTLAIQRPYMDYSRTEDLVNGSAKFTVYNKSTMPLQIIETDYQTWENGIKGDNEAGVESIILYPDKNNINLSFASKDMSRVTAGEIEFGGGFCVKYTTLNREDSRYWIYEVLFRYDAVNKQYNVFRASDNMASAETRCDVENLWVNN